MMVKLQEITKKVYKAYDEYSFDEVFRILLNYMSNDLSAFYLDFTKDILYIESKNHKARRSIQTVFYHHLLSLVVLFAPLMPFTSEEVYSYISTVNLESVYLERMNDVISYPNESKLLALYSQFQNLRDDVLKAIEMARNEKIIGKSLSSKVVLYPNEDTKNLLAQMNIDLKQVFIVSEFVVSNSLIEGYAFESGIISVTAREGIVCKRCWQVVDKVNNDGICNRCEDIIKEIKE